MVVLVNQFYSIVKTETKNSIHAFSQMFNLLINCIIMIKLTFRLWFITIIFYFYCNFFFICALSFVSVSVILCSVHIFCSYVNVNASLGTVFRVLQDELWKKRINISPKNLQMVSEISIKNFICVILLFFRQFPSF